MKGLDLAIPEGMVIIVGPNGAGKTTFLKAVTGLLKYTGKVLIDDVEITEISSQEKSKYLTYIPPTVPAMPEMNIGDLLLTGPALDKNLLERYVQLLGLSELLDRKIWEVSSGELERALIARGLARGSKVIGVDEPLSHADIKYQLRILKELKALSRKGKIVLVATNQLNPVLNFADMVIALVNGNLLYFGSTEGFLHEELISKLFNVKVKIVKHDGLVDVLPVDLLNK